MASYVIVCCTSLKSKDDVLLILKDRPDWQKGRLNLPGGKIEEGETPEQAGARELKEETGYEPVVPVRQMGTMQDGRFTIFCLKALVSDDLPPQPREGETETVSWHPWHSVLRDERLLPNLRVIVPLIRSGVTGWIIGDTYRGHDADRHTIKISIPQRHFHD